MDVLVEAVQVVDGSDVGPGAVQLQARLLQAEAHVLGVGDCSIKQLIHSKLQARKFHKKVPIAISIAIIA